VFDGVDTRELWLTDDPNNRGGILNITAGSNQQRNVWEAGDGYLRLVFRPLDPNFGGLSVAELRDPAKFRVRKQKGKIAGVACVVIETEQQPGMQISYWLDPARDYIPLRWHWTNNGEDRERLEISYRADPTCGWAPDGWTDSTVRMGGGVYDPITDTVTEFTVNQPIPASDFQIETSPNVKVQDWRNDRREQRREAARAAWLAKRKPIVAAREAREKAHPKPKAKPVYNPFADAAADVEAAFKLARETNKRVLIQFGANWCPSCRVLGAVLKENADVSAAVKKDFVLVFVDSETEHGRQLDEKYVPEKQRNSIPHLAVLDASGKLLKNQETKVFETDDDDYAIPKLKAFLAEWSPPK
jgi:thiol-disulfide isomerase/thioredoxin